jgi:hypothetical protein
MSGSGAAARASAGLTAGERQRQRERDHRQRSDRFEHGAQAMGVCEQPQQRRADPAEADREADRDAG